MKEKWEKRKEIFLCTWKNIFDWKVFLSLMLIYFLATSAIIQANFNYVDDMGRVAEGYSAWGFSRHISNFLAQLVHTGKYLTDISPLPQLLSILILALSSEIVIGVISEEGIRSKWAIISVLPLGLSPYYLECISYKFDSPYMALSVFVSIFPIILYESGSFIYFLNVFLGTLIMCMTYQASSGIFPMLVILLSLKAWNQRIEIKRVVKFIVNSAIGYLTGMIIFKVFIMKSEQRYVSNAIAPLKEIVKHLLYYYQYVKNDFKEEWLLLIGVVLILFIYVFVRDSAQNKFLAFMITVAALALMAVLAFGLYPVLAQPLYASRGMYGFGAFIAFIGVAVVTGKKMHVARAASMALSWCFVVFAFTYGNALDVQKEYTDFRIKTVITDLNSLEVFSTDTVKTVQISGSIGQSPILRNMPQDYQMLNRLVPITFRQDWMWGGMNFIIITT